MTSTQMRPNGILCSLACLAGLFLASPVVAASGPGLVVVDGAGTVIGPVVPGPVDGPLLWVVHPVGGVPVKLLVGENGPWDTKAREPLLYESTDCSGPALLDVPGDPDAVREAVIFATDVYWPRGEGSERTIRSAAWLVRDDEPCSAALVASHLCCAALPQPQRTTVAPAADTSVAGLRLSAPFHVEPAQ